MAEDTMTPENNGYFPEDAPHGDYSGKVGTVSQPDGKHELVYRKGNLPIFGGQQVNGLQGSETVALQKSSEYKHQLNVETDHSIPNTNGTSETSNVSELEQYRQQKEADQLDENHVAAGDR